MSWIILLLFLVPLYGQTIATTEDGQKVLLMDDGTWRTTGPLISKPPTENRLVYLQNEKRISKQPGLFGDYSGSEESISITKLSSELAKYGIKTTRKESAARLTLIYEFEAWSIIDENGETIHLDTDPEWSQKNRIRDIANVIRQLLM